MKSKTVLVSRILLGLIFVVFGGNGLIYFTTGKSLMPMPPPPPEMMTIMTGFMATKYLLILVKLIEVVAGFMLLANCYVTLANLLLAPIVVNIFCIHLFVEPSGLPIAIAVTVMLIIQFWGRWSDYRPLLKCK